MQSILTILQLHILKIKILHSAWQYKQILYFVCFFPGTIVLRINATDADEPNNLNSKIAFRIVSQSPSAAFSMDKDTGVVRVAKINLDREVKKPSHF